MSNVVQLFRKAPSRNADKSDITAIVSAITDWAEANGVDLTDRDFQVRCTDVVTLLQIMVNECPKAKVA